MERFVQFVAAGGVGLVAGLWLLAAFPPLLPPWALGAGLAVLGAAGVLYGTGTRVEGIPPAR